MQAALLQLAEDFLTAIVFVAVYLTTGSLVAAVAVAIAVGLAQVAVLHWRGRSIDLMQYMSVGLVIVLGGISLFLDDPRFVLMKPSAIHFAIAAVMLRRDWMARYMPPIVRENVPDRVLVAMGYTWAAVMVVLGLLNIYIALSFSITVWTWWISVGAIGAKVVTFLVQFVILRMMVRRNMRRAVEI